MVEWGVGTVVVGVHGVVVEWRGGRDGGVDDRQHGGKAVVGWGMR